MFRISEFVHYLLTRPKASSLFVLTENGVKNFKITTSGELIFVRTTIYHCTPYCFLSLCKAGKHGGQVTASISVYQRC
jgi:hypothetical protein